MVRRKLEPLTARCFGTPDRAALEREKREEEEARRQRKAENSISNSDLMKAIVQLQAALESSAQETRQLKAEVAVLRGSSSGPSGARAVLAGPGRSEREGNVLRV